jgi:hypothetical protein
MTRILQWYQTARLGSLRLADEGGWIQAALLGAGLLGKLFGGGAKQSQEAREKEAALNVQRDRTTADVYGTQQDAQFKNAQAELDRRKFALDAPTTKAHQVALGDLLANLKDVNIQAPSGIRMGNITGGLRPSVLGENSRAAGAELSRDSLQKLLDGESFDPIQMLQAPTATATPQAGKAEKLFGLLGTLGGLAGGVGQIASQSGGGGSLASSAGATPGGIPYDPEVYRDPRLTLPKRY